MNEDADGLSFEELNLLSSRLSDLDLEVLEESSISSEIATLEERYEVKELIGEGAFKSVYDAQDLISDREVAYAVLKKEADELDKEGFLREARITASLQHPGIIPVYDMGLTAHGRPFFTMKKIGYRSLEDLLKESERQLSELLEIFIKVCEAIAYAHSRGIIHLDLKPANIRVSRFGEVLVCDWGLAKVVETEDLDPNLEQYSLDSFEKQNFTIRGQVKGTPGYLAPEQAQGPKKIKDEKTDIYSLGAILCEIITKKLPVSGSSVKEIVENTAAGKLSIENSSKLPELMPVVYKALALESYDRYNNLSEFNEDIRQYILGFATQAENASLLRQLNLLYRRNRQTINLLLVFFWAITALLAFGFFQLKKSERTAVDALAQAELERHERVVLGVNAFPRLLSQSLELYDAGKLEECRKVLDIMEEFQSENPQFRSLKGKVLFLLNENELARKYLSSQNPLESLMLIEDKHLRDKELLSYFQKVQEREKYIFLHWLVLHGNVKKMKKAVGMLVDQPLEFSYKTLLVAQSLQLKSPQYSKQLVHGILRKLQAVYTWNKRRKVAELGYQLCEGIDAWRREFMKLIPRNLALGCKTFSNSGNETPTELAVDGDRVRKFWAGHPNPAALTVDMEEVREVTKLNVFFYVAGTRYYKYKIYVSVDAIKWNLVCDMSENTTPSTVAGDSWSFEKQQARFVKIYILRTTQKISL
ncbi:MAG: protein kinase [Lentisphaeraceae bacterium]|nr:protein kinase [Lentisphaeraceae bacterium]